MRGSGFLSSASLEARADREGAMAANGEQVYAGPVTSTLSASSPSPSVAGPMQAKRASTASREAADKAAKGDFSEYYKISSKDKEHLTADTKDMIRHSLRSGMDHRGMVKAYGETTSDKLNPVTRQAMSEMIRNKDASNAQKMILTNAMDTMDEEIMVQTMLPVSDKQRDALKEHYRSKGDLKRLQKEYQENGFFKSILGEETMSSDQVNAALNGPGRSEEEIDALARKDVNQANQSGEAILKLMLLMQMGHFIKSTKKQSGNKDTTNWYKSMANSLSYGGRVGFLFDSSKEGEGQPGQTYTTDSIFQRVFGSPDAQNAPIHRRAAATHRLLTPKAGQKITGYKEQHGMLAALKGRMDSSYHNYGMDLSVGGAGNAGVQGEGGKGQTITTDGRSGHLYVGSRDSSQTTRGGMLVGMETESPYRTNQLGHMHTAMAKSDPISSTGGVKHHLEGDRFGGRTVDFNGATNEDIALTLDAFSAHLNTLRNNGEVGKAEYERLVRKLSGDRMTQAKMNELMEQLLPGDEHKKRRQRLARARKGRG